MIYFSDMSRCRPDSALSNRLEKDSWTLIPYKTKEVSGILVSALSFINAPELTLPIGVSGWHSVYVGYWNPFYAYDNGTTVKIKLSGDPCFCRIKELESCTSQTETAVREVFFKYADLTGQDFVIGKVNGPRAEKALVAYVKLVPLSSEQVEAIREDRARTETKRLVAAIDGMFFWGNEHTTKEHIIEEVERYRHSDVGKVLWAANYGDIVNYPSDVATFWAAGHNRARLVEGAGTTPYIVGQKAAYDKFIDIISSRGIVPQEVIAEHVHKMGRKFDIMFRLGIHGGVPPWREEGGFVARYPELRQVMRDGTPVEKASYAFPEVRAFMLSLIREAARRFDVDGVNLCFVRGVRGILDEIGLEKDQRLELSVWAWPGGQDVWCGNTPAEEGLDIQGWIEERLLDSFICQEGVNSEDLKCCKRHGCQFILFPGYRPPTPTTPKTVAEGYRKGVDGFAIWDINADYPEAWEWYRRIGHRAEMETWGKHVSECRRIPLVTVGGFDVAQGLQASVYSGG
jgi:hypothetical protein